MRKQKLTGAWAGVTECMTKHAVVRMQQRGIPPQVVEGLLSYGSVQHDHRGARILFFDHDGWRRMLCSSLMPGISNPDRYRRAYAVLGEDGAVVTVSHRTKRIWRH